MGRKRSSAARRPKRSVAARLLRTILLMALIAFAIGFAIGSLLRRELERPTRYLGARFDPALGSSLSAGAQDPGDVRDALARILVSSHDEEQVG
jgi:hypothetical protein